jgi:nucleoside-triphosphatase
MTAILITGKPGVGKTTCIRKIAGSLEERHPIGFYTQEIREHGIRVGFELVGLGNRRLLLAHTGISSRYRVGKYRVDIAGFEEYLTFLPILSGKNSVFILDEIGKMECFSPIFRDMITRLLESDCLLIATIAKRGDPFIEAIKSRGDISLFTVTKENRDTIPQQILEKILVAGVEGEKRAER